VQIEKFTPGLRKLSAGPLLESLVLEFLSAGMDVEFPVSGSSMSPFIRPADLVTVRADGGSPGIGDIILWHREGGRMVLHRVLVTEKTHIITRGDALGGLDEAISPDRILGKAVALYRNGRPVRFGISRGTRFLAVLSRSGVLFFAIRVVRRLHGLIPPRFTAGGKKS